MCAWHSTKIRSVACGLQISPPINWEECDSLKNFRSAEIAGRDFINVNKTRLWTRSCSLSNDKGNRTENFKKILERSKHKLRSFRWEKQWKFSLVKSRKIAWQSKVLKAKRKDFVRGIQAHIQCKINVSTRFVLETSGFFDNSVSLNLHFMCPFVKPSISSPLMVFLYIFLYSGDYLTKDHIEMMTPTMTKAATVFWPTEIRSELLKHIHFSKPRLTWVCWV